MLNRVIDWSVTNRLLVVIGLLTFIAAAVFFIPRLNLDAFPDVTNIQVAINTEAPGLACGTAHYLPHRSCHVCLAGCRGGAVYF